MTARVITLKGPDAGRYYVEEVGRYYLDGEEVPGRWRGGAAVALGLTGSLAEGDVLALMDGLDPTTSTTLGTAHTERTVRGFDLTCSAPKSVSVLFAVGDADLRAEVLAAHDAAVDATVDWLEAHAHTRFRVNGEIWTVDAQGIAAALFREHTSRAHDPQIHTHVVIPNRVLAPDGRWLALDARTLKCDQRTMSALYHAGLRAELTRRIGARWHVPENGIAEMADADPAVLAAFSERTCQVDRRAAEKVERFADSFARPPTSRELWRLQREAVTESRSTKTSVDAATLRRRWLDQLDDLGVDRDQLVDGILGRARPIGIDDDLAGTVVDTAERALRDKQSTWRPAEVSRELAAAVPTGVAASAAGVGEWVDGLRSRMEHERLVDISRPVPAGVPLRRDGRPVTESAVDRLLTTEAILDEEERVLTLAQRWADEGGADRDDLAPDHDLTSVQREAAAAVAGDRRLVLVVGPAGTGKTTALRPAVEQLRSERRIVFGVAPSATAAEVLAVDTGLEADTLDKLLVEHRLRRPPEPRYDLPEGATVLVDEAAMVATPRLAELVDLAERRCWRLALVGDPMQFSAVGRSGMFGHLVDTVGATELDRVHRFDAEWERAASLRLRRGDADVVSLYEHHDRLHGGTAGQMARATVAAWRRSTLAGETAAMMAPTREAVAVLNGLAQAMRMGSGEIDPQGPSVRVGERRIHVGDVVATRHNERRLRTDRGRMVKNRDRWTIESIQADGALTVTGATGRVRLPFAYVAAHVELAYAETSHAKQGRTVDRSFFYLDGPTDTRGVYVPLTRGRSTNEAFVTITGEQTAAEVVADAVARTWIDQPATALRADQRPQPAPQAVPRPTFLSGTELRALVARAVALEHEDARRTFDANTHSRNLGHISFARRQAEDRLVRMEEQLARAEETLASHDRPLHRRGHRDAIHEARADVRRLPADLTRLQARLRDLQDEAERETHDLLAGDRSLKRAAHDKATEDVRTALVDDARARGTNAAADPSPLLVAHLGDPPSDGPGRDAWIKAAGRLAQHHELYPAPPGQVLGPRPEPSAKTTTPTHITPPSEPSKSSTALAAGKGHGRGGDPTSCDDVYSLRQPPFGVTPSGYRALVGFTPHRVAVLAHPRGPGPWAAIGPTGRPGIRTIPRRRYHLAASPCGASDAGTVMAVRKDAPWP